MKLGKGEVVKTRGVVSMVSFKGAPAPIPDEQIEAEDRDENMGRITYVARLLSRNGVVAITAAISPY